MLLATLLAPAIAAPPPIRFSRKTAGGIRVAIVTVELSSPRVDVRPVLARGFPKRAERLEALAARSGARAAVTAGFFDTRTLRPIGDIVIDRKLRHFGGRGAALCVRRDPRRGVVATLRNTEPDRHTRWKGCDHVLGGGIRLLQNGKDVLNLRRDGFDRALGGPHPRAAIALTAHRQMLLVTTRSPVTLARWSRALRALGATDALNMDGGSSAGLVFAGTDVQHAARRLPAALVVRLRPGKG